MPQVRIRSWCRAQRGDPYAMTCAHPRGGRGRRLRTSFDRAVVCHCQPSSWMVCRFRSPPVGFGQRSGSWGRTWSPIYRSPEGVACVDEFLHPRPFFRFASSGRIPLDCVLLIAVTQIGDPESPCLVIPYNSCQITISVADSSGRAQVTYSLQQRRARVAAKTRTKLSQL